MDDVTLNYYCRYRPLVDNWSAFLDAVRRPLPACVVQNPRRVTGATLQRFLASEQIEIEPITWSSGAFRWNSPRRPANQLAYKLGLYNVQEEAALLPMSVLPVRSTDRVLDLCAAPGNKTAQAAWLAFEGTVVANDRSGTRLHALGNAVARLGLVNVVATHHDARHFPMGGESFDKVICDVPCSGDATIRKHPNVVQKLRPRSVRALPGVQEAILRRGLQLCRLGGYVVYSTCSFNPEENEAVVHRVLASTRGRVRIVPVEPELGSTHVVDGGVTFFEGETYDRSLRGYVRLWPHRNDTGGFSCVLLQKLDNIGGEGPCTPRLRSTSSGSALQGSENSVAAEFAERFGMSNELAAYRTCSGGRKRVLSLVGAGVRLPTSLTPQFCGIPLAHLKMTVPKPTTSAAIELGHCAGRRVVDVDKSQALRFVARQSVLLSVDQAASITRGHVIVRYRRAERSYGLGIAIVRKAGVDRYLVSEYPKSWSRSLDNV